MKKQQQAAPEETTDADGQQLVHVALANTDQRATLYAEDFQRWLAAGFPLFWSFVNTGGRFQYVLANVRSPSNSARTVPVARWIADAGKGQRVSYADGDRLNLRRDNLVVVKGGGAAKAAAAWLKPNDGTPPRRKPKAQKQDAHAAPVRPSETPRAPVPSVGFAWRRKAWNHSSSTHNGPIRPTVRQQTPAATMTPRAPYVARVVDVAALGQRVREQMASKAVEVVR